MYEKDCPGFQISQNGQQIKKLQTNDSVFTKKRKFKWKKLSKTKWKIWKEVVMHDTEED